MAEQRQFPLTALCEVLYNLDHTETLLGLSAGFEFLKGLVPTLHTCLEIKCNRKTR